MFEQEMIISSLKKQSECLKNLVEDIEKQPIKSWQETQYYHETLKKIEASLKRIRKMDENIATDCAVTERMKYIAYPMKLRDSW